MKIATFKYKKIAVALALAAAIPVAALAATGSEPATLDADTVEYNTETGLATASGNVLMTRGDAKVTGANASYNTRTMEGYVEGSVIAVKGNTRLTCARITTDGQNHMLAEGGVHGTQLDKSFVGERVDYYPNQNEYVLVENGGKLTSADGTFTADKLEGWLADEHYIGTGSAHVVSPPRQLEAGGDHLDYSGRDGGRVIITGNAWAVQENNTMKSNRLTIYLADGGKAQVTK